MSRRRGRSGVRGLDDGWESRGGYMNAKKEKLRDQFKADAPYELQKEASGSNIFSGVIIYVNGYTKPSSDELKRLMRLHGGNYEHYLARRKVTHVVASNLPDSKVREIRGLKVVRPEWIMDSIAAERLLDYSNYLLYTSQSGLQKGLASFTIKQPSTMETSLQTTSLNTAGPASFSESTGIHPTELSPETNSVDTENLLSHSRSTEVLDKICSNQDLLRENSEVSLNGSVAERTSIDINVHRSRGQIAKAGDPSFLSEFYGNSRLHYLSTWKAEFKNYINELQTKGNDFSGREELLKLVRTRELRDEAVDGGSSQTSCSSGGRGKLKRCVMHIDMDCFFVSVGLRNRPDLKGCPVAVTHSRGRGISDGADHSEVRAREREALQRKREDKHQRRKHSSTLPASNNNIGGFPDLSDSDSEEGDDVEQVQVSMATGETFHSMSELASCSYEARKAGVRNGMFMGEAKRVCPQLVTIPYDFDGYKSVSRTLYDTVASYTHDIEAVSCDEMLVDCTDLLASTGATPLEFSSHLRQQIFLRTGCHASAGLASSILLAKLATKKAKPNGQFHLTPDLVDQYIKPLIVKDLPGVGWSLTRKFETLNVRTCGDLQGVTMEILQKEFGPKTGQSMYRYCRGQDDRPIKIEHQRKSVSAEVNYGIRFKTESEAIGFVQDLSSEVCSRLKNISMRARAICLKLMVRRPDAPTETSKFMGHGVCNNLSKSVTMPIATDEERIVGKECVHLLHQMKAPAADLRGIGIQLQKLEPASEGHRGNQSCLSKNQTILNFAVNKNHNDKEKPSTSLNVATSDSNTVNSATSESGSRSPQGQGEPNEQQHHGDVMLAAEDDADQQLACGMDVMDNDKSSNKENIHCPLMTSHLPVTDQDILWDLGQRQSDTTSLPPLPCLPELSTPDRCHGNRQQETTPSGGQQSDLTADSDYFPSPSQVDPDVLKELPADIRQQVEAELKSRKRKINKSDSSLAISRKTRSASATTAVMESEVTAGPSGLTLTSNLDQTARARDPSHDAIVPLPSPSQLDPSCLEALPPALQDEIRQAYAQQKGPMPDPGPPGDKMLTVQLLRSPGKTSPGSSPKKRSPGKGSPQFKVPRGRPTTRGRKRGTSKKLLFRDQPKLSSAHASVRSTNIITQYDDQQQPPPLTEFVLPVPSNISEPLTTGHVTSQAADWFPDDNTQTAHSSSVVMDQSDINEAVYQSADHSISLCGAISLEDVKHLLKEWIASTSGPQVEDEEVLITYLQALVMDKNLEKVDRLLKFMLRHVRHSNNWYKSLRRIYIATQSLVQGLYNAKLVSIVI